MLSTREPYGSGRVTAPVRTDVPARLDRLPMEPLSSAGGRRPGHHLDPRWPRGHAGGFGGGRSAGQSKAAAHRRTGRAHGQRLSRRRGAGRAVLRASHRPAGPQAAVQHHPGRLPGGHGGNGLLVGLLQLPAVPVFDRGGHRRRIFGDQLGDPGTYSGAPARPYRSRHQRQLLAWRGRRCAAVRMAARSQRARSGHGVAGGLRQRCRAGPRHPLPASLPAGESALADDPWQTTRGGGCRRGDRGAGRGRNGPEAGAGDDHAVARRPAQDDDGLGRTHLAEALSQPHDPRPGADGLAGLRLQRDSSSPTR